MNTTRILRTSLLGVAATAALGLAAACGGGEASAPSDETAVPSGATEFVVVMHDNTFEPAEFSIKQGQSVTIVAKNEGTAVHNLVVVGAGMASDALVNPGAESRFEVRFDRRTKFKIQCDYHLPEMVGEITVR
ncbi:MAG TPA: cupredoxin domain-containing protein [Tepidiformaceae bacterium]|nr:cupredoxin domain-containing protein [Tepidiformaceae bacterium]HMO94651.1 cupredoxin domain-containing protein [Tepidiformaceae bacterium]